MKNFIFLSLFTLIMPSLLTAQVSKTIKTQQDSASFSYGIMVAQSLMRQMDEDLNADFIVEGIRAGMKNDSSFMGGADAMAYFSEYNRKTQLKAGEKERTEGERFLKENTKRKEVTTTASGLQYEVMKKGTGTVSPAATDKVTVHYHGTLIDGTVFDSSVERGEPATFGLNQVIKGWTEGVQLMKAGDKFKFFLPYALAYGDRGAGPKIKPFSALIFEVELLEVGGDK